ncbi:histidine kinase [Corynebacterium sp. Q4381]|uniref:histidine kinase n=1 Tax=Corynebacterium sp. Marseille-Q4381 TaxID=3121597 RepID=UPI002FE5FDAB
MRSLRADAASRRAAIVGTAVVLAAVAAVSLATIAGGVGDGIVSGTVIFPLAAAAVLGAAYFSPVAGAVGYGVLLQFAAAHAAYRGPLIVAGSILLVALLGLRARPRASIPLALLTWYLLQTHLTAGVVVPDDLATAVFLLLLLAAAWASGTALRNAMKVRSEAYARYKQQLDDERERTVKALHGSVAASLTSVVLRSEALAMAGNAEDAASAQLIAEDARRAMHEVRELIRFMRSDDALAVLAPAEVTPFASLQELTEVLRSHGFTVIESGLEPAVFKGASLPHAAEVCREMQTNLLKYADPSRPVIVAAVADDGAVTVAVQNMIAPRQRNVHMTTGIGLEDIEALVAADGGSFSSGFEGDTWRYELRIPNAPK